MINASIVKMMYKFTNKQSERFQILWIKKLLNNQMAH